MPLAEVVGLADVLGGLGDLGERRQHAAGGDAPKRSGERDSAGTRAEPGPGAACERIVVDAVERPGELDRDGSGCPSSTTSSGR